MEFIHHRFDYLHTSFSYCDMSKCETGLLEKVESLQWTVLNKIGINIFTSRCNILHMGGGIERVIQASCLVSIFFYTEVRKPKPKQLYNCLINTKFDTWHGVIKHTSCFKTEKLTQKNVNISCLSKRRIMVNDRLQTQNYVFTHLFKIKLDLFMAPCRFTLKNSKMK